MTGKDLIIYILANDLENEPVVKDGRFVGLLSIGEVAAKTNVGMATVHAWIHQGRLDSVSVSEGIYIPVTFKSPLESISA